VLTNASGVTWLKFIPSDTKFKNTCSFIIHVKRISACYEVFVECILVSSERKEVSSTFESEPLTPEAFDNTKKLKRACIERFRHFDTWGSRNKFSITFTEFPCALFSHLH
jgi:hypothetical protein